MEADYHYYLEMLKKASEAHECLIHSYVLMTKHVQNEKSVKQSSSKLHKQLIQKRVNNWVLSLYLMTIILLELELTSEASRLFS